MKIVYLFANWIVYLPWEFKKKKSLKALTGIFAKI